MHCCLFMALPHVQQGPTVGLKILDYDCTQGQNVCSLDLAEQLHHFLSSMEQHLARASSV